MKKFIFLLFINTISYSQTISKQINGAAGKTQMTSNLKVSWTTGEPVVGLMSAGDNQLGNGYYLAMNLKALSIEDNTLSLEIKVYPNPTSQSLYVSHPAYKKFSILIADLNGKQIFAGNIEKEVPLDVSSYTQGIYLITIEIKDTNIRNTYKIIKK